MPIKTTYLFVEWGRYLTSQWLPFIQIAPWLSVQTTDIEEYSISVVLYRSDDGETWKEHTLAYLESRWEGGEEEIYQVFIFNSKKISLSDSWNESYEEILYGILCKNLYNSLLYFRFYWSNEKILQTNMKKKILLENYVVLVLSALIGCSRHRGSMVQDNKTIRALERSKICLWSYAEIKLSDWLFQVVTWFHQLECFISV